MNGAMPVFQDASPQAPSGGFKPPYTVAVPDRLIG